MKGNKKIATAILALMVTGCSTSPGNLNSEPSSTGSKSAVVLTDSDIKQLDKEYSAFTTKSFSQAYLDKKLNKWLTENNEVQLLKELLFAQIKHPDLAQGYFTANTANGKYPDILGKTEIINKMAFDNPFAVFMGAPSIPTGLSATPTGSGFTASWGAVTGADSYDVIVDGGSAVNVTGTSYNATVSSGAHTWKVRTKKGSLNSVYTSDQNVTVLAVLQGIVETFVTLPNNIDDFTFDSTGNIYATNGDTIKKITPGGSISDFVSVSGMGAQGLSFDNFGNLYITDTDKNCLRRVTPGGIVSDFAGLCSPTTGSSDGTGETARFNKPRGGVIDSSGNNLYVGDEGNHAIRKITIPGAVVTTFAGSLGQSGISDSTDGTGATARFNFPHKVALDRTGENLYVADLGNATVRKITVPASVVTTFAGTVGSTGSSNTPAKFNWLQGVEVDKRIGYGDIYIADYLNCTIRKITPGGTVSTIAGSPGSGISTDGTGAAARFNYPTSLKFDNSGNLYVADRMGKKIRKIH